jgi:putative OPT family oligopeptide transporter
MACAEVLVAAEEGGSQAAGVFWGIGVGMAFKLLTDGVKLVRGVFELALPARATVSIAVSPPLIGVGYILGIRIATVMVAGGILSALLIIPAIFLWGSGLSEPLYPETEKLIRDMSTDEIWNRYVRYIGAGAVATGGMITLIRSIPTMVESFRLGLEQIARRTGDAVSRVARVDRDLSPRTVVVMIALILAVMTLLPGILGYLDSVAVRLIASLLIAVFAFFFVTVSSRIVGLVGVTSNPTSGMTIATLLGTSLVFLALGWTDMAGKATALMVGTAVAIAASIAGDTSQDLKTGFILGATPRYQQIGELIGVITSAGVVVLVVMLLQANVPGGLGGPELPAPQATLMALVIDGVLDQNLPWLLIVAGVVIGLAASLFKVPVLAFAVGVYLPLDTMAAVFAGGLLRYLLTRRKDEAESERRREQGVLFGSGLVGGGGLTGVVIALWVGLRGGQRITGLAPALPHAVEEMLALATIAAILGLMAWFVLRRSPSPEAGA